VSFQEVNQTHPSTNPPAVTLPPAAHAPQRRRAAGATFMLLAALGLAACGEADQKSVASSAPAPAVPAPGAPAPGPAAPAPSTAIGLPSAGKSCSAFPLAAGEAVEGTVAGSAGSDDGRPLSYSQVTPPRSGSLTLNPVSGAFTYVRASPSRGDVDSFVYRVTDKSGQATDATALIIYGRPRIMALGDSITDGVESYNEQSGDLPAKPLRVGYRKALRDRLLAAGYAVDFVGSQSAGASAGLDDPANEGYSGARQRELRDGITTWLNRNPSDVVLLHIGTNDVNAAAETDVTPIAELLARVDTWSSNPANPAVQLQLATIIGQRFGGASYVPVFNRNLKGVYQADWADPSGARPRFVVRLIDMNAKLDVATDLSDPAADSVGLHPNPSGYRKMADTWFDALVQGGAVHKCP